MTKADVTLYDLIKEDRRLVNRLVGEDLTPLEDTLIGINIEGLRAAQNEIATPDEIECMYNELDEQARAARTGQNTEAMKLVHRRRALSKCVGR